MPSSVLENKEINLRFFKPHHGQLITVLLQIVKDMRGSLFQGIEPFRKVVIHLYKLCISVIVVKSIKPPEGALHDKGHFEANFISIRTIIL